MFSSLDGRGVIIRIFPQLLRSCKKKRSKSMGNVTGSSKNYCIYSYVSSEVKILRSERKTEENVPILSL